MPSRLNQILEMLKTALRKIYEQLPDLFPRPAYDVDPKNLPMNRPEYLWDTPQEARHSVRMLCDEMGLTLYEKNVITACIQQESGFRNKAVGQNWKNGVLHSTDWGICQINDFYHVGPGKKWPTVKSIVDNPEKAVRWMITLSKNPTFPGKLDLWVSFSSGAYRKYMP